ncbi:streptophobe family protein, partial [Streptomyces sp. NPDC002491]
SKAQDLVMNYQVQAGSAAWGATLWVAVVVALGCLVTRRAQLPEPWAASRLWTAWAPCVSAVTRMFLTLTVVPLVAVVFVGVAVGGKAATAAGAAILMAPDAVAVFLTLGLGASWTASTRQVQSEGGNPLASLLQWLGGRQSEARPDRVENLRHLSPGGWPLWAIALALTVVALSVCGHAAARATARTGSQSAHPRPGRHGQHLALAGRLAVVMAVFLGTAAWLAQADGRISATVFGSRMGGTHAQLSGSVPTVVVLALIAGAAAGYAGSLLYGLYGGKTGRFRRVAYESPAAAGGEHRVGAPGAAVPGVDRGPLETPVGNR